MRIGSEFVAVSAVVALTGSAFGIFQVTGSATLWSNYRAAIERTSWFALDERGGASGYAFVASEGKGANEVMATAPRWNAQTGESITSPPAGIDGGILDDGSAIRGGEFGMAFSPSISAEFEIAGEQSQVNGRTINSIFVGNIALTDPSADLVGGPFVISLDHEAFLPHIAGDVLLPLDGTPIDVSRSKDGSVLLALEVERDRLFPGQLELFVIEVPAPGVVGLFVGLGVIAAHRRR